MVFGLGLIQLLQYVYLRLLYHSVIVKIQEHFPKYGPLFVNVYFLSLVIYVGCGFLPQMASRGGVYFHFMELLIVPMVLFSANKFNRAWIFTLYALFSLWRHIDMVTTYGDAYMPYKNILFS